MGGDMANSMTVLVHGTYSVFGVWWKPGGSLHEYLKVNVFPDVYDGNRYFRWSGKAEHDARVTAAERLIEWCDKHASGVEILRLISHSHGANVANIATHLGLKVCTLIHLAPAVPLADYEHKKMYLPNMANVSSKRFFNFYPETDKVLAGYDWRQNYQHGDIPEDVRKAATEIEIEGSDSHFAPTRPKRWEEYDMPEIVTEVCAMYLASELDSDPCDKG